MSKNEQILAEKQRIFFKMPADKLQQYCEKYPLDSLSAGIMNARFTKALDTMFESANQNLNAMACKNLAVYIRDTFNRGQIIVDPTVLHDFYGHMLTPNSRNKNALQSALTDFLAFARAPMTPRKKEQLDQFVARLNPRPATPFEIGMDRYKAQTSLFPHSK